MKRAPTDGSMTRVHRNADSVRDSWKVRRRIFNSKSEDRLFCQHRNAKCPPESSKVLSICPPHLQFVRHGKVSAGFSSRVRSRVHSSAAKNGISESTSRAVNWTSIRVRTNLVLAATASHSRQLNEPRTLLRQVRNVPMAELAVVHRAQPWHNVRLSDSPNSNLSDLEDEDSVSPGGGGSSVGSDADRLAGAPLDDVVFVLPLGSRRFRDWRAIWAIRRRSMFSSGWNRRHRASPTVGSTSWWNRTHQILACETMLLVKLDRGSKIWPDCKIGRWLHNINAWYFGTLLVNWE